MPNQPFDHIDGLFDPVEYIRRLQAAVQGTLSAVENPEGPKARPLYVLVEKILTGDEALPAWPAEGTTGYDFLNDVWGATVLRLPPELAGRPARNVFTAAQVVATPADDGARLRFADVLAICPVAILHSHAR